MQEEKIDWFIVICGIGGLILAGGCISWIWLIFDLLENGV